MRHFNKAPKLNHTLTVKNLIFGIAPASDFFRHELSRTRPGHMVNAPGRLFRVGKS